MYNLVKAQISIHAPREGSDPAACGSAAQPLLFLSTLPARGATKVEGGESMTMVISIHAPREGSDNRRAYLH